MEERMARIEGALEQMDRRINHIESELSEIRVEIRTVYRTMLLILIPMWVTIIGAIIGLALTR